MNTHAYLRRIGLDAAPPCPETLVLLQRAHYQTVPYENLDILLKNPLSLDSGDLYRKVVTQNRGGYCFELNGLFGSLLTALGFRHTQRLARFLKGEPNDLIPMGRHRVLLVEWADKIYVCDVGIGCPTPCQPLQLCFDQIQTVDGVDYRFVRHPQLKNLLEYRHHGVFEPYYAFGDDENFAADYIAPSLYCELSPDSPFNKGCMAHIFTEKGRISLEGSQLKRFEGPEVAITDLNTPEKLDRALREIFFISLTPQEIQRLFDKN